jgi:hypothetical protein
MKSPRPLALVLLFALALTASAVDKEKEWKPLAPSDLGPSAPVVDRSTRKPDSLVEPSVHVRRTRPR